MLATRTAQITAPACGGGSRRALVARNQTMTATRVVLSSAIAIPTPLSRLIVAFARLKKMTIGTSA